MKRNFSKLIILLTALLLILACSISPTDTKEKAYDTASEAMEAETAPEALPTPAFEIISAPVLTQIEMLDAQNGWAHADEMILRTENGGESWLNVTPPDILQNPAYSKSYFLDTQTGWLLLEDIDKPNAGMIFRTTDGGGVWNWRNVPFGRAEFGFSDLDNGYALFNMGAGAGSMGVSVWMTSNGGGDFARVFFHEPGFEYTMPFSGIKNGITFRDALNGWVTGSVPMDGVIWFYRTRDGGLSWEEEPMQLPAGYENAQTSTFAPRFFDLNVALLPVRLFSEESAMVFYRTSDGGETWTPTLPVPMSGKYAIASPDELIVWDGGTTLYASQDGGESWTFHATNWQPYDLLRTIDFVSATEGWALSEDGVYRTSDGGKTWEKPGQ